MSRDEHSIKAPSHYIQCQAAKILGLDSSTIAYHCRPNGALAPEDWYGTKMIPAWKVQRMDKLKNAQREFNGVKP